MDELNREDQAIEETEEEMEENDIEETADDEEEIDANEEEEIPAVDLEVAKYRITGLVDIFDEQMNIKGQFPIGSIQELPVEYGSKAVEDGRAELVTE